MKQAYEVRVLRVCEVPTMKIDAPELARAYWNDTVSKREWFDPEKEQAVVLILNTRYAINGMNLVSVGTMNESLVHPREVFRAAIAMGAYGIILMHNHPSGDPSPSQADHSLTRRIHEGAEILQIKLLDHVIVGDANRYFSFKEAGVL